jgi:hypothetical protein
MALWKLELSLESRILRSNGFTSETAYSSKGHALKGGAADVFQWRLPGPRGVEMRFQRTSGLRVAAVTGQGEALALSVMQEP